MPTYVFRCPTCKGVRHVTRTVEERNEPLWCDGHGNMPVLMSRSIGIEARTQQIVANPVHLRDEWRDPRSATEQREAWRKEDAEYDGSWESPTSVKDELAEEREANEKAGLGYEPESSDVTVLA